MQGVERRLIFGIEANGNVEVLNGFMGLARVQQESAQTGLCDRVLGAQRHSPAESGQRALAIGQVLAGLSQVAPRHGKVGTQFDGLLQFGSCPGSVAFLAVDFGPQVVWLGCVWLAPE